MQLVGGFFGNLIEEEMGVGLGGVDKFSKFHELLLSDFRQLTYM